MPAGALNGLAQCLLRLTCPGIPDLYQGREDWDFSLVDPDNRRIPDFPAREAALDGPPDWPALLRDWRDGRIKQTLIARVLGLRRLQPGLFRDGDYLPLEVSGEHAAGVLAFARRSHAGQHLLVVVPRLASALLGHATPAPGRSGQGLGGHPPAAAFFPGRHPLERAGRPPRTARRGAAAGRGARRGPGQPADIRSAKEDTP